MAYKFFDKNSASLADESASGSTDKSEIKLDQQLVEELQKPINGKLEKERKVY